MNEVGDWEGLGIYARAEAVAPGLAATILRKKCGAEQPVPDRELGAEVLVVGLALVCVMPAVHPWSIDHVPQPAEIHIQIGVDEHAPDGADGALEHRHFRSGAEQHDRRELDRL